MKIAVWHNLVTGGAKRALHMHVKGLHQRGHRIHVYSTTVSDRQYLPLAPYADSETLLPLQADPSDRRASWRLDKDFRSKSAEQRIHKLEQIRHHTIACAKLIAAEKCDVLFGNSCQFNYNSPIGSAVPLPSVSYLQEPYRPFYEASPRLPWLLPSRPTAHPRNPLKRLMERSRELHENHALRLQATEELSWAQAFTRILCNSKFSRESILRAYNLDSKVCYLGVDGEAFQPLSSEKEPYVLYVGSMHHTKRVDAALLAVAAIPQAIRPALLCIGNFADDHYKNYLYQLAEQHQVNLKHRILVNDQELQVAMAKAACFLYTPHLEPFGLTPLEANACGTAVVGIAEGGVRETIVPGINGFLSLDLNTAELAQFIIRFTENLDYAKAMGLQAREHVLRHWSIKDAVDRVEQHLAEVQC